jgi:hypothetical protein
MHPRHQMHQGAGSHGDVLSRNPLVGMFALVGTDRTDRRVGWTPSIE